MLSFLKIRLYYSISNSIQISSTEAGWEHSSYFQCYNPESLFDSGMSNLYPALFYSQPTCMALQLVFWTIISDDGDELGGKRRTHEAVAWRWGWHTLPPVPRTEKQTSFQDREQELCPLRLEEKFKGLVKCAWQIRTLAMALGICVWHCLPWEQDWILK